MTVFEKGRARTVAVKGDHGTDLSGVFLEALLKEFDEFGAEAIRICRVERPHEFIKIIASILPKEFELTDNRLHDITDDELIAYIEYAQRQLAGRVERIEDRTGETAN